MLIEFVVLHYQNYNDTINCVNSILDLNLPRDVNIKVFVIDNASPNRSGERLRATFRQQKNVLVHLLDDNIGFSKANNIGYQIAKKDNADIIIMSNNDIIVEDKKFVHKLKKILDDQSSILCPDILNANGQHQNPMRKSPLSDSAATKNYISNKIFSFLLSIPCIKHLVYTIYMKKEQKWQKKYYKNQQYKSVIQGIVPHGAFLIYTKKWIDNEDIAFPSDTFMYLEEDFLSIYALRHNHIICYVSKLRVRHLEGHSVNYGNKKLTIKLRFKIKLQSKALRQYLSFLKTGQSQD